MEKYTKYEFIQNTKNKELNKLFENPSYEEIEAHKNNHSKQGGYAESKTLDLVFIIAVLVMVVSYILFKVVS